jgi:hypothetical protein
MPDRPGPLTDPVARTLARFTPAAGLDRDEVLFRAGRASAPKGRWWKRATALLLVTQAATLVALMRPGTEPVVVPPPAPGSPASEPSPDAPDPFPPGSYGALTRAAARNGLPPSAPAPDTSPGGSPLSIASARRGLLLD